MHKRYIFLFLLITLKLYAQQDSISYYLNDKGLSRFDKVIKTDLSQLLKGNFMCIVEKDISGYFRLEYGGGLLTGALMNPLLDPMYRQETDVFDERFTKVKMKPGISLYVSPRYSVVKFPNFYSASTLMLKYYVGQLFVADVSFTLGYEYNISPKWVLDVSAGVGTDILMSSDNCYYVHKNRLFTIKDFNALNAMAAYIPLSIKLGYRMF